MKKFVVLVLVVFTLCVSMSVFAQNKPNGQKAWDHVNYLASDDFKGRKSGTPEYQKAAEYVAAKMKEFGLKPGGENGTYFQEVTFKNWSNFDQPIRFEVTSPQHRVYFAGRNRDYSPVNRTGSGKVKGQLVFAGYGVKDSTWNDYKNINAKGKIVLVSPGAPEMLGSDKIRKWNLSKKITTAIEHGAIGLINMNVEPTTGRRRGVSIRKDTCPDGFVVMNANRTLLDDIFYLSKTSWKFLVSKTIREKKSYSRGLNVTAEMEAHYTFVDSLKAPNVIGIIPGNDKKLKDEYLIVGGHLDHLGVGIDGFINNGADDDAGSAGVILEIARVMKANRFKPDRTIVFASWAGEELGLVGSRYYTNHPIYPLEKTAIYMNMDMVGNGDTDLLVGGMWEHSDFFDIIKSKMDEATKNKLRYRLNYRGSDHSAFLAKDVTWISLRSGNVLTRQLDDEHPEYHMPGDIAEFIEPELLELAAQYHYDMLVNLSKTRENLFDKRFHINNVHKNAVVADLHCDTINRFLNGEDLSKDNERGHIDIPKLKEGAVDLQVFACYVGPPQNEVEKFKASTTVFNQIDAIYRLAEENKDDVAIVRNNTEFSRLRGSGKVGIMIGIEGGYAIENELGLLRSFHRDGVRLMTLTHWLDTDWADASGDEKVNFDGLTDFGEEVVKEMNKLGMIIDVSHVHDKTFWDVIELTDSPIVASHSCCRALSEHHRNMSDEMLKALAENDGVIGINFAPGFLKAEYEEKSRELMIKIAKKNGLPTNERDFMKIKPEKQKIFFEEFTKESEKLKKKYPVDVKTVVDHIEHVIKVTESANHVGLGSDFDGISGTPTGLENAGKLANITKEMFARGFKKSDINKTLGGNFMRVFRKVCK